MWRAITFSLDPESRSSYPVQVVRQATAQVVAGRLHPGDRLPSVRQLARDLGISRTTAERIHGALCESMLAEVRPRSGTFVAAPEGDDVAQVRSMQAVYEFLKDTSRKAQRLGLDVPRLVQLLSALERTEATATSPSAPCFPLVATRDFYECIAQSLSPDFPARLVHIPPSGLPGGARPQAVRARYVLSSYYMRARAREIAQNLGCTVLYLRYNTALLNEWADIPAGRVRTLLTRDTNNADTIKVFLAHAYPEVSPERYRVLTAAEWLKRPRALEDDQPVWAMITAKPLLRGRVPRTRLRLLHPLLGEDFIDELRCLALLG